MKWQQPVSYTHLLVLDLSGEIGTAAYAAPTILSFQANVQGKASHAGFNPEAGIHSIKAACEAIAVLPQGHIDKETTANIGLINGGEGINIVPSSCNIRGEIRSLNHEKALATAQQYRDTFQNSAEKYGATLDWTQQIDIQAVSYTHLDLYPKKFRKEIDEFNDWLFPHINNGHYRMAFCQSPEAYDEAYEDFYDSLEKLDKRLETNRFLFGDYITDSDVRAYVTLVRWDVSYYHNVGPVKKPIKDYKNRCV